MTVGDDLRTELNRSIASGAIIVFAEINLNDGSVARVHNAGNGTQTFLSLLWRPFPFAVEFPVESGGQTPRDLRITVGQASRLLAAPARASLGFVDRKVRIYFSTAAALAIGETDGGGRKNYLSYSTSVTGARLNRDELVLDLSRQDLVAEATPKERATRTCRLPFKSTRCGYSGAGTFCDKTLHGSIGCTFYSNVTNHGGFPGMLRRA